MDCNDVGVGYCDLLVVVDIVPKAGAYLRHLLLDLTFL
jgi:hypothetical protein